MLSIISENLVLIKERCKSKNRLLKELVEMLYKQGRITDVEKFYKEIISRERVQSTGIGNEIAIPHAKSECVKIISVVICICKSGLNFNSLDGKPVRLIFLIAAPSELTKVYLQVVAKIARILKTIRWKEKFINCNTEKDVINILQEFDKSYPDRLKINLARNGRILLRKK